MSASSKPIVTPVIAFVSPPAPKRDKFASMVARQPQGMTTTNDTTIPIQIPIQIPTIPVVAEAPKRDKLASMASLQSMPPVRQDTVALLSVTSNNSDRGKIALKTRIQQRQTVLQDLESTEGLTWKLIHLARDTAHALTDLTGTTSSNDIAELSKEYRETLSKIHQTLQPHGNLVKAYQNHQVDTGQKEEKKSTGGLNMYAARVEMRLAQEKQRVLTEMLQLEQEQNHDTPMINESNLSHGGDESNKRKR